MSKRIHIFLRTSSFVFALFFLCCLFWNQTGKNVDEIDDKAIRHNPIFHETTGKRLTGWQNIDDAWYYYNEDGSPHTGWLLRNESQYYFDNNGILQTGWITDNGRLIYLNEKGCPTTGWTVIDTQTYYFQPDGTAYTGWYYDGEYRYYFFKNGIMATGRAVIDDRTYYFSPHGIEIPLVNANNYLPEDYDVEIYWYGGDQYVAEACYHALEDMMDACYAAGFNPAICSSYRTYGDQIYLYNNQIDYYLTWGYDYETAAALAGNSVAIPGTSEHHLGLAVDIVDSGNWRLDETQAEMPAQKWLMEHCWEYGFIHRYPIDKTEITGIVYEPWHYRYVGKEVAMEMRDLGVCLEEYLGAVP